jgi:hypothetical protein
LQWVEAFQGEEVWELMRGRDSWDDGGAKMVALFGAICIICQDRLGTDIQTSGKRVEKKGGSRRVGSEADGVCAYTLAHYPAAEVINRISSAIPFHYAKNDQITQTGSGQT